MKSKHYKTFVLLLASSLFIIGCKKQPFDHRNKYVGEWEFKVHRSELNTDSIGYYEHDSLVYTGEVTYGSNENELLIQYTQGNSITLTISKEGILSGFPTHYCNGEFRDKDKLHLYLKWGGLGGGITHVIDGEKE